MQISRDEWLSALGEAMPRPDPTALTAAELATALGMARSTTEIRLRRLLSEKKAIKTVKLIQASNGRTQRVTAYKLVTGKRK